MTFILLEEVWASVQFHYTLQTKSCLAYKEIVSLFLFNRIYYLLKSCTAALTLNSCF